MRTLLVDNHDSYTYNLFQLLADVYGSEPRVIRNDAPDLDTVDLRDIDAVVISPGPGNPEIPADAGRTANLLHRTHLPVLGVCFGHQLLGLLSGARIRPAPAPVHGRIDRIRHTGQDLFAGIADGFAAVRYHSLCLAGPLPDELEPLAWSDDGVVMAIRHRKRPWRGVQFHPESVGTEFGVELLRNFAAVVDRNWRPEAPNRSAAVRPSNEPTMAATTLVSRELAQPVDTQTAFSRLFAEEEYSFWLDSSRRTDRLGRYSFLGMPAGRHAEVLSYRVGTHAINVLHDGKWRREPTQDIFATLRARLARRVRTADIDLSFPLLSGYVGYLGYEVRDDCGSQSRHRSPVPDAVWITADRMVVTDHDTGRSWICAARDVDDPGSADEWLDRAQRLLDERMSDGVPWTDDVGVHAPRPWTGDLSPWAVRAESTYLADIAECQRELRLGNSYEICLTNAFDLPFSGDPLAFYRRLRVLNPAPYSAYLRLGDLAIASSSPERFLSVDGGVAESRPIKGTAPRESDPERDEQIRNELATDPKTVAENLMIADLLRNDLGSVSEIGSVTVPELMRVETYATLHQLVTTVQSRLKPGVTAVDCAQACFPGGSMTGAPKERTMDIIDRLEGRARGPYSGALGYFSDSGECDLSIVIRTAVIHAGRLILGAGGAIVLDSESRAEHDEMLLKAYACLRALDPEEVGDVACTGRAQ